MGGMSKSTALRRLGPEPYGNRLRRAREEAALDQRTAAQQVSKFVRVDPSTLSRLEKLAGPPTDINRRTVIYTAAVIYGVDPSEFAVTSDDVPAGIVTSIHRQNRKPPPTRWYTPSAA